MFMSKCIQIIISRRSAFSGSYYPRLAGCCCRRLSELFADDTPSRVCKQLLSRKYVYRETGCFYECWQG